jgi:hypothetical protein
VPTKPFDHKLRSAANTLYGDAFRSLLKQNDLLNAIAREIKAVLPVELADQIYVTEFSAQSVTISTYRSAVASQIRFLTQDLLFALHRVDSLYNIRSIKIRVLPATAQPTRKRPTATPISKQNSELLLETASRMDSPDLARALSRLASHTRPAGK